MSEAAGYRQSPFRRGWIQRLLDDITAERMGVQQKQRRRPSTRRMYSLDQLPMPRVFMRGPRWRSSFGVHEVPIVEVNPDAAKYHRPGRKLLMFTLEDDVRELVCRRQIRPGIVPEWDDELR